MPSKKLQSKICPKCGSKNINPECLICTRHKFIYDAIEDLKYESYRDHEWWLSSKETRFLKNAQKNRFMNPIEIEHLNAIFRKCMGKPLISKNIP